MNPWRLVPLAAFSKPPESKALHELSFFFLIGIETFLLKK